MIGGWKYICGHCETELEPRRKRRPGWGRRHFDDDVPFCPKCEKFKKKYRMIDPEGNIWINTAWGKRLAESSEM